jgi:hypothetical protein
MPAPAVPVEEVVVVDDDVEVEVPLVAAVAPEMTDTVAS